MNKEARRLKKSENYARICSAHLIRDGLKNVESGTRSIAESLDNNLEYKKLKDIEKRKTKKINEFSNYVFDFNEIGTEEREFVPFLDFFREFYIRNSREINVKVFPDNLIYSNPCTIYDEWFCNSHDSKIRRFISTLVPLKFREKLRREYENNGNCWGEAFNIFENCSPKNINDVEELQVKERYFKIEDDELQEILDLGGDITYRDRDSDGKWHIIMEL